MTLSSEQGCGEQLGALQRSSNVTLSSNYNCWFLNRLLQWHPVYHNSRRGFGFGDMHNAEDWFCIAGISSVRGAHLAAAGDMMLSNRRACTYLRWPCSLCGFLATGSCVQLPHSIYDKRGELSKGHVAVERNSSFGLWSKIIAHPTSPVCVTSCIWEVTEKQCTALCRMSF